MSTNQPTNQQTPTQMSTIQDTDLLLVNRGGVDYKCTAADVKAYGSAGGGGGAEHKYVEGPEGLNCNICDANTTYKAIRVQGFAHSTWGGCTFQFLKSDFSPLQYNSGRTTLVRDTTFMGSNINESAIALGSQYSHPFTLELSLFGSYLSLMFSAGTFGASSSQGQRWVASHLIAEAPGMFPMVRIIPGTNASGFKAWAYCTIFK